MPGVMEGFNSGIDNWRGPDSCCGLCPELTIVIHMDEGLTRLLTCSERWKQTQTYVTS